jgi:hypothetical protein
MSRARVETLESPSDLLIIKKVENVTGKRSETGITL